MKRRKKMHYKEIQGDLIKLALYGKFQVIAHGCNCFCVMGAGIAPQMAKTFGCDKYVYEEEECKGEIMKLGNIMYAGFNLEEGVAIYTDEDTFDLAVVNAYTQYGFGQNHPGGSKAPLDYEALTLCLRKMNHEFKGKHIGLPQIGCGLAGGDWERVKQIIQQELQDCDVTVVIYKP